MRTINWLEDTSRSLSASFPALGQSDSVYMTHRMSRLILDRLPSDVAYALLSLLPEADEFSDREDLYLAADRAPDLSIGYSAFVESAAHSIHQATDEMLSIVPEQEFLEKVTDYFLWAFAQELPPELKQQILQHLPVDLRNRMNLYSSHADDSKVA